LEHTVTLGKSGTGGFYPNAIRYRTPDLNGFSSEVGYSFGSENTGFQSEAGRNEGLGLMGRGGGGDGGGPGMAPGVVGEPNCERQHRCFRG
ncbi:hypothetical protein KC221_24150, partial [Mycobacterium tuberculosis]|nr:hypothetical protein [Mycobacterium tuberculosis]